MRKRRTYLFSDSVYNSVCRATPGYAKCAYNGGFWVTEEEEQNNSIVIEALFVLQYNTQDIASSFYDVASDQIRQTGNTTFLLQYC